MPNDTTDTTDNDQDRGISATEAADLRRLLSEANNRAASAERTASEATRARRQAELASMSAEEKAVATAQDACESELSSLEAEASGYEREIAAMADEPGHGKEIADLTRKLSRAESALGRAAERKEFLAAERDRVTGQNKKARERAEQDDTGSDMALPNGSRLSQYGPQTQSWMQAHPRIFTDQQYFARAVRYATEATDDLGIKDQSAEYFRHIEEKLGEATPARRAAESDEDEEGEDLGNDNRRGAGEESEERYTPERPQTRAAGPGSMAAAAPPSRRVPQGGGNGGRQVKAKLSAEEREVADNLYADMRNPADRYAKYAENKAIMNNREPQHFTRH